MGTDPQRQKGVGRGGLHRGGYGSVATCHLPELGHVATPGQLATGSLAPRRRSQWIWGSACWSCWTTRPASLCRSVHWWGCGLVAWTGRNASCLPWGPVPSPWAPVASRWGCKAQLHGHGSRKRLFSGKKTVPPSPSGFLRVISKQRNGQYHALPLSYGWGGALFLHPHLLSPMTSMGFCFSFW